MKFDLVDFKFMEAYTHAELYRLLKNCLEDPSQRPSLLRLIQNVLREWFCEPYDVLFQFPIKLVNGRSKEIIKKADLVLFGVESGNMKPLLIVEVKKRS